MKLIIIILGEEAEQIKTGRASIHWFILVSCMEGRGPNRRFSAAFPKAISTDLDKKEESRQKTNWFTFEMLPLKVKDFPDETQTNPNFFFFLNFKGRIRERETQILHSLVYCPKGCND